MIIRDALFADLEKLMPLAHEAHQASVFAEFPMNEAEIQRRFTVTLYVDDGYARVIERDGVVVGGLLGAISMNQFGVRCASDLFNYSQGGTHLLLKDFKEWAKARGAYFTHITDLGGEPRYHKLLRSAGFNAAGLNFIGV